MKNKKKNIKTILASTMALTLLLAGVGVMVGLENQPTEQEVVKHEGIKLKALQKTENADGSVTQTISYSVQPAGATDKSIYVEVMQNGQKVTSTDVVSVTTQSNADGNGTISVTVKQAFNKQYIVNVHSNYDNDVYSSFTIDYEKKLLSLTDGAIVHEPELTNSYVLSVDKFYTANYSLYTKDKTYTYKISNVNVDITSYSVGSDFPFKSGDASDLENIIKASALDGTAVTDTEIWNAISTTDGYTESEINDYHSWLYDNLDYGFDFNITYTITCNETGLSKSLSGCGILDLDRAYSGLVVGVNGITLETTGLTF